MSLVVVGLLLGAAVVLTSQRGESTVAVRMRLAAGVLALLYALGAENVVDSRRAVWLVMDP